VSHITLAEAQAWLEQTKLKLPSLDADLESTVSVTTLAQIGTAFPVDLPLWVDVASTPQIIRKVIAMRYAGWAYDRQYSEDASENAYAIRLLAAADVIAEGIVTGSIAVVEVPPGDSIEDPIFFPNDVSTANAPTDDFPSDGPEAFDMGKVF
jgi:hypothetical protein